MLKSSPRLTILTTTYNRSCLLHRCYESLCKQTCKNFEWLIVDDGSTDTTEEVVNNIKKENPPFAICYVKKENGGKHTALNFSHPYINGEYLLMLDDDDYLTADAVEIALQDWSIYTDNEKIGCISYQRADLKTNKPLVSGYEKPGGGPIISNYIDFRVNAVRKGDCAEVVRTSMFVKFPAPVYEGEKFLPEDFLWVKSAFEYDTVYISKVIYLCEYRTEGLTKGKRKNRFKNPLGGLYTCNLYFNSRISFLVQIKKAVLCDCYALATGESGKYLSTKHLKGAKGFRCKLLLPVAGLIYCFNVLRNCH